MALTAHNMRRPRNMNLGIVFGLVSVVLLTNALVASFCSDAFVSGAVQVSGPTPTGVAHGVDVATTSKASVKQFSTGYWALGSVALLAIAAQRFGGLIRHGHRQRVLLAAKGGNTDNVDMLMKAGLRNLLGVEDNKMAQKLQAACKVSEDMKRCMADCEVKLKLTTEELGKTRRENNKLREQLAAARKQSEETDVAAAWALAEALSETEKVLPQKQETKPKAAELEYELAAAKAELAAATEAAATAESALVAEMAIAADATAKLEAELACVKAELAMAKDAAVASEAGFAIATKAAATVELALAAELEVALSAA